MTDPDGIAGLLAWYKADSLSLSDGEEVTAWTDSSTNTYDLAMAAAYKPTYETNAVPDS